MRTTKCTAVLKYISMPNEEMLLLAQKEKMYPLSFYTDFLHVSLLKLQGINFPLIVAGQTL